MRVAAAAPTATAHFLFEATDPVPALAVGGWFGRTGSDDGWEKKTVGVDLVWNAVWKGTDERP